MHILRCWASQVAFGRRQTTPGQRAIHTLIGKAVDEGTVLSADVACAASGDTREGFS
jgi:hypothetical protein